MICVVLADPPGDAPSQDRVYPNMGVLYLAAHLRAKVPGLEVHYITASESPAAHAAMVAALKPNIYGLSFAFLNQRVSLQTIRAVRKACPGVMIVCGGPGPTAQDERVLQESPADCCVIGEGEETFTEIVQRYLAGRLDWSDVAGISYRRGNEIARTAPRPLIENLDAIPFPAWDLINPLDYAGQHYRKSDHQACLVISRGCPYHCAFCSNPVWKVSKPWVRMRSPQRIAEEVQYLYGRGVREIKFVSDELNVNLPWAKDICRAIAALGHKDLYFQTNLRADKVDDEFASLLRDMGCWLVHLGVESANDRVLEGIGKHVTVEEITRAAKLLSEHGIKIFTFMMAFQLWRKDGRIEAETRREVARSLRYLLGLRLKGYVSYMSWSVATPMPDSPLWDIAAEVNPRFGQEVLDLWDRNHDYLGFDISTLGVTEKDRQAMIRWGILTKGLFALLSGHFALRKHWFRVPVLVRSFLRGARLRGREST